MNSNPSYSPPYVQYRVAQSAGQHIETNTLQGLYEPPVDWATRTFMQKHGDISGNILESTLMPSLTSLLQEAAKTLGLISTTGEQSPASSSYVSDPTNNLCLDFTTSFHAST